MHERVVPHDVRKAGGADSSMKKVPEMMKSGLVSTFQTLRQVGKDPEEHAVDRADPETEQRVERKAGQRRHRVERHRQLVDEDDPARQQHPDHQHGQEVEMNLLKTASSGETTGYCRSPCWW